MPERPRARPRSDTDAPDWDAVLELPFGRMGLRGADGALVEAAYLPPDTRLRQPLTALAEHAARELLAWVEDPDRAFSVPLAPVGTAFQRRVWQLMLQIPRGSTLTYGDAAARLGSAARAVGQACGANPLPPFIPCHRIVAAGGLGGFAHSSDPAGHLLAAKRWLLRHEGAWHG